MKIFKLIPLLLIIISCGTPQPASLDNWENWVYKDQNGNQITLEEFRKKWGNKDNNLVRYDYIDKDTGRVASLVEPVYSRYQVKYAEFSRKLGEITGKESLKTQSFFLNIPMWTTSVAAALQINGPGKLLIVENNLQHQTKRH